MNDVSKRRRWIWWMVAPGIISIGFVVLVIPNVGSSRCGGHRTGPRNACINNLRQLDGAIEQWALENKIQKDEPVVLSEVVQYIKGGMPKCPGGGKYIIGKVDEPPRCTIADHTLTVSSVSGLH